MSVNENTDLSSPGKKLSKNDPAVQYTDESKNPAEHRCQICVYLLKGGKENHGHYECGIVAGTVKEMGGCKLFDIDLIVDATSKINLGNYPANG
jgi:hypothetical protein